jgi:hypothetical protein
LPQPQPQPQHIPAQARSAWKGTILEHLWIPALWSFLIPLFMVRVRVRVRVRVSFLIPLSMARAADGARP